MMFGNILEYPRRAINWLGDVKITLPGKGAQRDNQVDDQYRLRAKFDRLFPHKNTQAAQPQPAALVPEARPEDRNAA
jgi:hypothetical protein